MKKKESNITSSLSIRNIKSDDLQDLFIWRNHPVIKMASLNTKTISLSEHQRWFRDKIRDKKCTIYILYSKKYKVGVIRFEKKAGIIKVSVMLNPDFIGRGLGCEAIKLGVESYLNEKKPVYPIIAEIKKGNNASINAFKKSGFDEGFTTYILNKKKYTL